MRIRIASRESRLAMWQAEHVRDLLIQLPDVDDVQIVGMTTKGDRILDQSLSKIGGKGLFIKELEMALMEDRADLAVHSGKDIPMDLDSQFELLGFMTREDPTDAFVSNEYESLADMPAGAVVGSSSLRRQAQVLANFPHLVVKPLRGNLDTRLGKLDRGEYQGIVLATAGLKRLNMHERIRQEIPPEQMLPAVGQGAL
ncbi:MAG: hydroxymethylbilane synthase, partial [Limnobacter sp.]|nr:hydroxymethylbilane synthase [Limnobacter sp.]